MSSRAWWGWQASALVLCLVGCRPVLAPRGAPPMVDPTDRYDALLSEVVSGEGYVDYDALSARRDALDAYVAWVAQPRDVRPEHARHAFWLNAYNALVLYAVLEDGRPASVRDVRGWLPVPGAGFFYERAFLVDGRPTSLWEIEHEILRFRLLDPRDHGALVCGMRGCPPLRAEAYREGRLRGQLDDQMRRWLADPVRGLRVEEGTLWLSQLLHRYRHDFEFDSGGVDLCAVLSAWAPEEQVADLRRRSRQGCRYEVLPYDTSLNDASGTARPAGSGRAGADPAADPGDTGRR